MTATVDTNTYTPTEKAVAEALIVGDSDDKLALLPAEVQERMLAKGRAVVRALGQHEGQPRNVIEALARVMSELPGIGKARNQNGEGDGVSYAYRGIEAITRHAQQLLGKYGVVFVPKVLDRETREFTLGQKGTRWTDDALKVEYTVYGPGGVEDRITVGPLLAMGRDNSDKGFNKAMTQAFKYALIQTLCIGDGKDDADGTTVEQEGHRTFEAPDADKQARLDLASRVKSLNAEERTDLRAFCEERVIPPVPAQMDDGELEAVTAWLDALEVRKAHAAAATAPPAPPEAGKAEQPTLDAPEAATPPTATADGQTDEPATQAKADPERLTRAQQALKAAEEVARGGQAEMSPVEEEVIRSVTLMAPGDLDHQLGERGLLASGSVDARRKRLATALIAERASQEAEGGR